MESKKKLTNVKLIQECGRYYLTPTYEIDDGYKVIEKTIHKVPLPLSNNPLITYNKAPGTIINIGFGEVMIPPERGDIFISEKIIKERVHELTVAEIEMILGYKVKIVGEKKEYPIKDLIQTCRKCRFYHSNDCAMFGGCVGCPNKRPAVDTSDLPKHTCLCSTIRSGEPCPYFQEWEGNK